MNPTTPAAKYKCQTCCVSFATLKQLEVHLAFYEVRALK
jgi:hypothetical protein